MAKRWSLEKLAGELLRKEVLSSHEIREILGKKLDDEKLLKTIDN